MSDSVSSSEKPLSDMSQEHTQHQHENDNPSLVLPRYGCVRLHLHVQLRPLQGQARQTHQALHST